MMRWLLTYADLITLLLIMFIVLYSMSQVSAAKFRAAMVSIITAFAPAARSPPKAPRGIQPVLIEFPKKEYEKKLAEVEQQHPEARGQVCFVRTSEA